MKSLFWKIFVSFWLALILFAGLTLWTTSHYLESMRHEAGNASRVNAMRYMHQARELAQRGDIESLRQWLQQLDDREPVPYLLLDGYGQDIFNRSVPLYLQQRVRRLERKFHDDDHEEHGDEHHERPRRAPVLFINGQRHYLMPDYRSITLSRVLHRPRAITIPILIAAFISMVICLLLARYLTAPIGRLRHATQKMAQGDLTQRVSPSMGKRKDEIVELANDFDYMAEQLQALIGSHKQLLRDASHELRSPLARLQVALGLARQRGDGETEQELDRIEREAERLNDLIGQLLTLARYETSTTNLEFKDIELAPLLEQIVDDAAFEAHTNNRDVKLIESRPVTIKGNSVMISSALENIIRNALRYTAENTTVEVSLDFDKDSFDKEKYNGIVIKVHDHGPGIPEQMLDSIFEPFVRVGEARDRQSGGYGLGLAIAKRAVNLHGGKITALNVKNENEADGHKKPGLIISIYLPV